LIVHVLKLSWKDLQLDETRQAVKDLRDGPKSTFEGFLWAVSRFENFLGMKRAQIGDFLISEDLLIEYFEEFLFRLSNLNGQCVLDFGSFFPNISLIKKYISLRFGIKLGDCHELHLRIQAKTKTFVPTKKKVFTLSQLQD
jgi:hypothetical protein